MTAALVTQDDVTALIGPPDIIYMPARLRQIMHALAGRERPVPVASLAAKLGISESTVRVHLFNLREYLWTRGFDITNVHGQGYCLVRMEDDE